MIKFLHHLFTPHCPDCRAEFIENREELKLQHADELHERESIKVCESCQTLTRQLEIANAEKERLLDRLLEITNPSKQVITQETPKVSMPRAIPWNMRRQMLENEDRRKAQLSRQAPKADAPIVERADIKDLEKDLGVDDGVENQEAENQNTSAKDEAVSN